LTFFWENPKLDKPGLLDRLFPPKWWVVEYERGRVKFSRGPFATKAEAERERKKDPERWDDVVQSRWALL
jgi:hypothetical protein